MIRVDGMWHILIGGKVVASSSDFRHLTMLLSRLNADKPRKSKKFCWRHLGFHKLEVDDGEFN